MYCDDMTEAKLQKNLSKRGSNALKTTWPFMKGTDMEREGNLGG